MNDFHAINRRRFLKQTAAVAGAAGIQALGLPLTQFASAQEKPASARPIPVILATDIGDDIDDTWALGLALKSPELDLKLVVGEYGKAEYRAKLIAKFLQTVGRSDIPVGVGLDGEPHDEGNQAAWVKDYELSSYPGKVRRDGVQAIIDTIHQSGEGVTVICIAPMPTLAAAVARDPKIATLARFVGMQGSLRLGYGGSKKISPEWNVKADAKACQTVFAAPWDKTITPLDTCGLGEPRWRKISPRSRLEGPDCRDRHRKLPDVEQGRQRPRRRGTPFEHAFRHRGCLSRDVPGILPDGAPGRAGHG